jgi:hypothetical protein
MSRCAIKKWIDNKDFEFGDEYSDEFNFCSQR